MDTGAQSAGELGAVAVHTPRPLWMERAANSTVVVYRPVVPMSGIAIGVPERPFARARRDHDGAACRTIERQPSPSGGFLPVTHLPRAVPPSLGRFCCLTSSGDSGRLEARSEPSTCRTDRVRLIGTRATRSTGGATGADRQQAQSASTSPQAPEGATPFCSLIRARRARSGQHAPAQYAAR